MSQGELPSNSPCAIFETMKNLTNVTLLTLILLALPCRAREFWLGADISGTTLLEHMGKQLYNAAGEPRENTALMKELGLNAIRLRVWVNPRGGWSGADDVLVMARRARDLNMALMIDFHYSDWWADPGKQYPPKAWKDLDYTAMCDSLAKHTVDVLSLLKRDGIDVRWVQVGNETTDGFLWETGRASTHPDQYAGLTRAGYDAVKSVYPDAAVIVHVDCGSDAKRYDRIFGILKSNNVPFDIIGMSVYPYWDAKEGLQDHWTGTIDGVVANANRLSVLYDCPVMIVETGVEAAHPIEGKEILSAIIDAARNRCTDCLGVFYWAPEAEGQYPLGAFENHRPTVIMDAFKQ